MEDFKPFNLAQIYQSADASVANALQSNLLVMQAQHMQRDYQDDQALRSAITGSLDPATGQMNLQSLMRNPVIASPKGQAYVKSVREAEKSALESQDLKGKVAKQQHEEAVQLARGVIGADPNDMPELYVKMRQQAIDMGHEGAKKLPAQWDPALLPNLKALAYGDMPSKDAAERADYSGAMGGAQPTTGQATQTTPKVTGAMPAVPTNVPTDIAYTTHAQENAAFDRANTAPTVDVAAAGPVETPEELRAKAATARAKGTKAGFDVARDLETAANHLEQRIQKDQELNQGKYKERQVSYDGKTYVKEYSQDGGKNWQPIEKSKPVDIRAATGAADITVKTGTSFWDEYAKTQGKALTDLQDKAQQAADVIPVIHNMRTQLDKGAFTGLGANAGLMVGRALAKAGFNGAKDAVANTQAYAAEAGNLVGQVIKQFGSGTGLSDADRKYAMQISAGEITMDEKAMRRLLDMHEQASRTLIQRYNTKASDLKKHAPADSIPIDPSIQEPGAYEAPVPTVVNPKTGEKRELREGKWIPIKVPKALRPAMRVIPEDVQGTPLQ